jgi:hypothetical protein
METSAVSKVNQAISDLEILKDKISSVTARYNVLNEDYSRLCEDAIAVIAKYSPQAILAEDAAQTLPPEPPVEPMPARSPSLEATPIPASVIEPQPAGCPSGDTAIPLARMMAPEPGPAGQSLTSMEGLEVKTSRAPSLEEIIAFQHRQLISENSNRKKSAVKKKISAQSVVDFIGDGIESGLDKIGNGIMFPFAKISDLSQKHSSGRR